MNTAPSIVIFGNCKGTELRKNLAQVALAAKLTEKQKPIQR